MSLLHQIYTMTRIPSVDQKSSTVEVSISRLSATLTEHSRAPSVIHIIVSKHTSAQHTDKHLTQN